MPRSISRLDTSSPARLLVLWVAILAGPLAWLLDLELSYALANRACESGSRAAYALTSLVAAALAGAAGWTAWRELQRAAGGDTQGAREIDRSRFLAIAGVAFSAGFLLLILGNLVPKLLLDPCR
jgi:hypothetical protein